MLLIKKILNHSLLLLIGNSIGRLAMFLANVFAARLVSQEVFGQFTMIRNTISMMEGFISGAIGNVSIKTIAQANASEQHKLPLIMGSIIFVNLVIMIIFVPLVVLFTPLVVKTYFLGTESLEVVFYVSSILLMATILFSMIQKILIGLEEYKKIAQLSFISSLVFIPIIWILIELFGLYGALLGISSYMVFDIVLKYYSLKRQYNPFFIYKPHQEMFAEAKKLMVFSSPLLLSLVISSVSFWYARIILINYSQGFSDLAIFDAAYQWLTIIMIITGATTNVAVPMLSKTFASQKENNNIFKVNIAINLFISISITSVFYVFSEQIMTIYGEGYSTGSVTLKILSIVSIGFTLSSIFYKYMISHSKVWIIVINSSISTMFLFIVLLFNLDLKNNGLAWAFLAYYSSSVVIYCMQYIILQTRINK